MKNKKTILSLLLFSTLFSVPGSLAKSSLDLLSAKDPKIQMVAPTIKKAVTDVSDNIVAPRLISNAVDGELTDIAHTHGMIEYVNNYQQADYDGDVLNDPEAFESAFYIRNYNNIFKTGYSYELIFDREMVNSFDTGEDHFIKFATSSISSSVNITRSYFSGSDKFIVEFVVNSNISSNTRLFKILVNSYDQLKGDLTTQWNRFVSDWNEYFYYIKDYFSMTEQINNTLIDGASKDVYINVDSNYSTALVVSQVTATDLFGKEVAVVVDTANTNYVTGKIGDFVIRVTATDDYGQTASATLNVHVIDATAPTITITSPVICKASEGITESDFLSHLSITDNVDSYSDLKIVYVKSSGFDFNSPLKVGNYNCEIRVTDKSSRVGSLSVPVQVIDDIAPTITRKDGLAMNMIIKLGVTAVDSNLKNTILSFFNFEDNVSSASAMSYDLIDSNIAQKVGVYSAKITCTDEAGNRSVVDINLEVIKDLPPVFILSNALVICDIVNPLKVADLKQLASYILNTTSENVDLIETSDVSDYLNSKNTAGTYTIQAYSRDSGQFATFDLQVNDVPLYDEDVSFWEWIPAFFQSLSRWFSNAFKGNFNWQWVLDNRPIIFDN